MSSSTSSWLSNIDWETVLGVSLGIGAVGYLWSRGLGGDDAPSGEGAPKRTVVLRDFQEDDLLRYNGAGDPPRRMYVAVQGVVFDVTSSISDRSKGPETSPYGAFAGKIFPDGNVEEFRSKFPEVGYLIIQREYTVDEIFPFDGRGGKPIYIAAKGGVYDITQGAAFYGPGKPYNIMAGRDASRALALVSVEQKEVDNTRLDDLNSIRIFILDEWVAKLESKYTKIGTLAGWSMAGSPVPKQLAQGSSSSAPATPAATSAAAPSAAPVEDLDAYKSSPTWVKKDRQQIPLTEKIQLSPDTFIFRFSFPDKNMRLGLPIGKHIKIWCPNPKPVKQGEWNGRPDAEAEFKEIERKYTPSSLDANALGYFDVVIKVYKPNEKFCDGGKMSQYIGSLNIGDKIDVAGPFGLIEYQGAGNFFYKKVVHHFDKVAMMAGGTGITPMLQIMQAILRDPNDKTEISLLFGNQTEEDILCRSMLDELVAKHPNRIKVHYTLDRPPEGWKYSTGFIDDKMISANLAAPGPSTVVLLCGPPPMIKFACKPNLEKLGYVMENVLEF